MLNKYTAFWFSSSSIAKYKQCPRAYYLANVYKTKNKKKISIVSPYLSLGVAVHDTLEDLAWLPAGDRLKVFLPTKFTKIFAKYFGKKGGFKNDDHFYEFEARGLEMIENVQDNPRVLIKPAVRMLQDKNELPWMWLSEEENIIISGKVDWLNYDNGKINIYDFKTNKSASEKDDSLQFHIYRLMLPKFKKYPVDKAFYWYLAQNKIAEKKLPTAEESLDLLMDACRMIKEARISNKMECKYNGCRECEPLEKILRGEGEYVGIGGFGAEQYYI